MYHQFGGNGMDLHSTPDPALSSSPTPYDRPDEEYDQYFRDDLRRSLIDDWKSVLSNGFLAALAPTSSPVKQQPAQQHSQPPSEPRLVGKVLEGVDSIGEAAIRWIESLEDTLAGALTVPTLLPTVPEDASEPPSPSTASQPSTASPSSSSSSDDLPAADTLHTHSPPPPYPSTSPTPHRGYSPPLKPAPPASPHKSVRVSLVADSTLQPPSHPPPSIPSSHPTPPPHPTHPTAAATQPKAAPRASAAAALLLPPAIPLEPCPDPSVDPLGALQYQLLDAEAKMAKLQTSCKLLARKCMKLRRENQDLKTSDPMLHVLHTQLTALLADKSRLTQENEALRRENSSLHELLAYASHGANESEACYTPSCSIPDPLDFHHHLLAEGYYDPPPPLRTRSAPASPTTSRPDELPALPRALGAPCPLPRAPSRSASPHPPPSQLPSSFRASAPAPLAVGPAGLTPYEGSLAPCPPSPSSTASDTPDGSAANWVEEGAAAEPAAAAVEEPQQAARPEAAAAAAVAAAADAVVAEAVAAAVAEATAAAATAGEEGVATEQEAAAGAAEHGWAGLTVDPAAPVAEGEGQLLSPGMPECGACSSPVVA